MIIACWYFTGHEVGAKFNCLVLVFLITVFWILSGIIVVSFLALDVFWFSC